MLSTSGRESGRRGWAPLHSQPGPASGLRFEKWKWKNLEISVRAEHAETEKQLASKSIQPELESILPCAATAKPLITWIACGLSFQKSCSSCRPGRTFNEWKGKSWRYLGILLENNMKALLGFFGLVLRHCGPGFPSWSFVAHAETHTLGIKEIWSWQQHIKNTSLHVIGLEHKISRLQSPSLPLRKLRYVRILQKKIWNGGNTAYPVHYSIRYRIRYSNVIEYKSIRYCLQCREQNKCRVKSQVIHKIVYTRYCVHTI